MTKLALFSDLHYYSPVLGTEGKAYALREGSDQKCLKETPAILAALCDIIAKSDADAAVLPGDVTNNGERPCHEEAGAALRKLAESKPVFVMTSTHDWSSDGRAKSYRGDGMLPFTDVIGREELPEIYADLGVKEEVSRFVTSFGQISRSYAVNGEVLVIAVNDDCDAPGGGSGYSEAHLNWMRGQLAYAKENGLCPVAFEHHLLIDNISPLINKGQRIKDSERTAAALADAGLRLMITGHSHFQRVSRYTSPAGNTVTQFNLGSVSGFPGLLTYLTVKDGKAYITEEPFSFEYAGQTRTGDYLREHTAATLTRVLDSAADDYDDFVDILSANGISVSWTGAAKPLVTRAAKKARAATVSQAAKTINRLTGHSIGMQYVRPIADMPLIDLITDTFLNLFWWGLPAKQSEEAKNVVLDAAAIPAKLIKRLPVPKKKKEGLMKTAQVIEDLARELEYPERLPEYIELL